MESDETENAPTIELTRRRALAGLATIGVGSAAAGAGTFAAFSDSESTGKDSFSAGTLDLTVGDSNSLTFSASDITPTASGGSFASLSISGTVTEGSLTPEVKSVTSTGTGDDSEANLRHHLEFEIWLDEGGSDDGTYDDADIALPANSAAGSGKNPAYATVNEYKDTTWENAIESMSSDWTFRVNWKLPDNENINDVQGDSLEVEFGFTLSGN